MPFLRGRLIGLLALGLLAMPAAAADIPAGAETFRQPPSPPIAPIASFRDRFEVRFGVGLHGVGSIERGSADLNAEVVFPQLHLFDWQNDPRWSFLMPRFQVGGTLNLSGRTSFAYIGALWTYEVTDRIFLEAFGGGAVHNGSLLGDNPNRLAALGCRALFHAGGSVGYRILPTWSVMFTFEHVSNGNDAFGACPRNQGLNNYQIRIGHTL